MDRCLQFWHLCVVVLLSLSIVRSDLVILKVERSVQNQGPNNVSHMLLALPDAKAKNLASIRAFTDEGMMSERIELRTELSQPKGKNLTSNVTFFSVASPKEIEMSESVELNVRCVFANSVKPFPEVIAPNESQLVLYTDNVYYTSPYLVKYQSLRFKVRRKRVESYTNYSRVHFGIMGGLIYGPFEEQPAFSYSQVTIHYKFNNPIAIANELVWEIEISHRGDVQVTEQYIISNDDARLKNGFSRLDYEARPHVFGPSFRTLLAILPSRSHSVFCRGEIGNISTSHIWGDSEQTRLKIELRSPLYGGGKTSFMIGYNLPLQDFFLESDGERRVLNISFGCPIRYIVVEKYTVNVC